LANATEDENKVLQAVHNLLPPAHLEQIHFNKTHLTGHYRNPITLFKTQITDRTVVQAVFQHLSFGITPQNKERLKTEIDHHLERGNLYLRFDKQSAFKNQFNLCSTDPIHFRIRFKPRLKTEIIAVCTEFGLLS
jgi:RNA binding exosome subunit